MKALQVILLIAVFGRLFAQDCNNPVQESLNIEGLASPTVVTEPLNFCQNFQNRSICCDAATINGFQTRVNDAITNIQELNSQRDRWLANSYNQGAPIFLQNWYIFQANMEALRTRSQVVFDAARQKFLYINDSANALRQALTPLRNNFAQYQQARVQCQQTMMDYFASAHCLACNPNYTTLGVSEDGNIALNPRVCTTIKNSCFRFVQLANSYALFLSITRVSEQLYEANLFLQDLDLEDNDEDLVQEINDQETPYTSEATTDEAILQPTTLPPNCTNAASCDWLCTDVFNSARVNTELLVLGGVPAEELSYLDITERAGNASQVVNQRRALQVAEPVVLDEDAEGVPPQEEVLTPVAGTWNPAQNQSGVQIQIQPNPAGVNLSEPVNETNIQQSVQAFQEPPNPIEGQEEGQEAALSGSVMTISSILLLILTMIYLE